MGETLNDRFRDSLSELAPSSDSYVPAFVDKALALGREANASDLHVQPTARGVSLRLRIDGVLQPVGIWPVELAPNLVARLKVLADLLTYRTDVPQEGRIRAGHGEVEMRVSTFPTLYGEKAVVRLFAKTDRLLDIADLGLPGDVETKLRRQSEETSGAILVTGPAGSGKTTTVYACLRELVARSDELARPTAEGADSAIDDLGGGLSLVSLEDPIEVAVPGVTQSQVNPAAGFDLAVGLRSLLRQDPDVIMVGEIRDRETAEGAIGASLTGHLVLTTFHAGSAAGAISRLADMGIEPYLLRSGLLAIAGQRLVRKLCGCARSSDDPGARLGVPVTSFKVPVGCERCAGAGYLGRGVLAELLEPEPMGLGAAILARREAQHLEQLAVEAGMITRWDRAHKAIAGGITSPREVRRVLGFSHWPHAE